MPITKQVIKRVKQAKKRTEINRHYRSDMKSMIKLILDYIQKKDADKATKILSKVIKSIDTCAKKNIIHKNNAAHKKARIQKALNSLQKGGAKKEEKPEVKPKKRDPETSSGEKKEAKPKVKKEEAKKK